MKRITSSIALVRPSVEILATRQRLTDKQAIAFAQRAEPCRHAAGPWVRRGLVFVLACAPAMPALPNPEEEIPW